MFKSAILASVVAIGVKAIDMEIEADISASADSHNKYRGPPPRQPVILVRNNRGYDDGYYGHDDGYYGHDDGYYGRGGYGGNGVTVIGGGHGGYGHGGYGGGHGGYY